MHTFTIPDDVLNKWQKIVDIMADILNVPSAIITRVDAPQIEVMRASATPGNPYKSGLTATMNGHYCETVIKKAQRLEVNHAPTDPEWDTAPEIGYDMLAYLGYPVHWPGGDVFGTVCVLDNKKNPFGSRYDKILGEFTELVEAHLALIERNSALQAALDEIHSLRELLPICCFCKKIRDDDGYWDQLEEYFAKHSGTEFTHCICPDCAKEHYPELNLAEKA